VLDIPSGLTPTAVGRISQRSISMRSTRTASSTTSGGSCCSAMRSARSEITDSDDEEESSKEDEDAIPLHGRRVFEAIHRIRSGDPRILNKDAKVYSSS
jgi:hypothetical protein